MARRRQGAGLTVVPIGEGEFELSWPDPRARAVTVALWVVGVAGGVLAVSHLPGLLGLGGVLLSLVALVVGANRSGARWVRMQLTSQGITVSGGGSPFRADWPQVSSVALDAAGGRVTVRIRSTGAEGGADPRWAVTIPRAGTATIAHSVEHWTGRPVAVPESQEGQGAWR